MINLEICQLCKHHLKDNEFIVCINCRNKYNLDEQENQFINLFMKNSLEQYQDHNRAISMSSSTEALIGNARRILNDIIVEIYKNSEAPLDILAVALTYARTYASNRPLAIQYFERWLERPEKPPKIKCYAHNYFGSHASRDSYSFWAIYATFATIYEKEYEFEKAIQCLYNCIDFNNKSNPADYTRIGDILIKIDINKAEDYYIKLLNDNTLKKFERSFAIALENVIEKKNRGYIYRPRRKKTMQKLSKLK